ncbi:hypothetical protein G3R49_01995 [Shewanella sp. WXL01]|uniref:Uncharacterized protein n=1 Tax=Shewanella maritima TaxID=2520507 RepID=A0A411PG09_9GAMM|nr:MULTISPECIES: hypothetical protein [Shewanella]NKF49352.1 hypothetical protein [Shewanella sp. WXL01]QBF82527.1 hypothetical protein EXU30_07320 [Shewanella maritima]
MVCKHTKQLGQALIESIIGLSFVIVPLLLLLPLMSKMTAVQHRAQEASHYNAWERTVWRESNPSRFTSSGGGVVAKRTDAEIAKTIPWRFYQGNGQKLASNYQQQWSWDDKTHPLLHYKIDQAAQGAELVLTSNAQNPQDELESDRLGSGDNAYEVPGRVASGVNSALNLLSYTGFSLESRPYYRTYVETDFEPFYLEPFDSMNLTFRSDSAILASGWNAGGARHVENRVRDLVLTNYLNMGIIRTGQRALSWIPFGRSLSPSRLRLGHVDPNTLPNSRLCTYGTRNCGG